MSPEGDVDDRPDATDASAEEDVQAMEERWLRFWDEQDVYAFDPDSDAETYAIDTPPPTVSGEMHIGHAYSYNQMDFVARYKRMQGYNLFYPFGFDDNGLPSERYTERETGKTIEDVGRKEFTRLCLEHTEQAEDRMERNWRRIGTSCDWSLVYRTVGEHARRTSQASFVELWDEDLAYREEEPTIWCPECTTAIAQVEVEDLEMPGTFHDIRFPLVDADGDVVISTTRPELLPACVAVFVHPQDEDHAHLAGETARVPLFDREVPILEDRSVDLETGTGVVMCCTFGDLQDIDWVRAHDLPHAIAVDEAGVMTDEAGDYAGVSTREAKDAIAGELDEEGYLVETEEIHHSVSVHERCDTPLEFLVTEQWFIDYLGHRRDWLDRGDALDWHPEHMQSRYDDWVEGLQWDWCISRQRYFGVPFPVWYCGGCDEPWVADEDDLPVDPTEETPDVACPGCGAEDWVPEDDVMDTWATSSMTPQIALDWADRGDRFEEIFPYDLRPQAHDIISFWAFNTIVKAHYHHDEVPWSDIMISGFVRLEDGKMSKSKGNIIRPMTVVEDFSGDALRYWSATGANLGEDIVYREKDLVRGQRVLTKLTNVVRFVVSALDLPRDGAPARPDELPLVDRWILHRYSRLVEEATEAWEDFDYTAATKAVEDFLWHTFADHYVELVKSRVLGEGTDEAAEYTLYTVALGLLKALAPVTCFRTEDLYQDHFRPSEGAESVHVASWPEPVLDDPEAGERGELPKDVIAAIRHWKSENGIPLNEDLPAVEVVADGDDRAILEEARGTVTETVKAQGLGFVDETDVEEVPVALDPVHAHIGPTHRDQAPAIEAALEEADPKRGAGGSLEVTVDGETLTLEEGEAYEVVTRPSVKGRAVEELHVGGVTVLVREE
jgi:valyl-tRNA synthetase